MLLYYQITPLLSRKTFVLARLLQVNSFQKKLELKPVKRSLSRRGSRVIELPLDQSFAPNTVTGAIKIEHLRLRLSPIDEDEQLAAQGVFTQLMFDHPGQPIEGATHVGRLGAQPHLNLTFRKEH
jgi:hypothetical protein|tara:strand:+ start:164 stop:538 length:375 start_codon:yes stop_codon:yes gene_type:complete